MKIFSKWLCLALSLTVLIPALAGKTLAAEDAAISDNQYTTYYTRWAETVKSTLTEDGTGYVRVEYIDGSLVIERYDETLNFVSGSQITLPLPIYGGVYICEDANFVVCGQTNREESADQEVIRVIKYTKDWQEVSYASLRGANTTVPFDAGSLRFARSGNMLFIRTCHEMYRSSDGYNHQANLTLRLDVSTMTILNAQFSVSNSGYGYCSHSFNQFIQVDGDTVLAVDHGDAHPRSIALFKYSASAQGSRFPFNAKCISVLPIVGETGDNSTGAFVGGFEYSSSHYLVAGNTVDQVDGTSFYGQRNIFVTATPKDNFTQAGTVVRYITDYADDSGIKCTAPHLVKISSDKFFLIWGTGDSLSYCFLNGKGEPVTEIYSGEGMLSDCVPIVTGNSILWYVTDDSYPVFYRINLDAPETVSMTHRHTYTLSITISPTDTAEGAATVQCKICGTSEEVVMPPLSSDAYTVEVIREPTCSAYGQNKITWKHETFGVFYLSQWVYPLDCSYGDWIVEKEPTCTEWGQQYKVCSECGYVWSQSVPKLNHDFSYVVTSAPTLTEAGVLTGTCSRCPETETVTLPVLSRYDYYRSVVEESGCTETGTDRYTWWNTYYGDFFFDVTTDALGHEYLTSVTAPSCTDEGYTTHTCYRCDHSYKDSYVAAYGHKEVTDKAVAATCTKDGKTEGKYCYVCGTVTKEQEVVKAEGHKEVIDAAVSATCTKDGKTEGKHCSVCGTVTKAQETVKAAGHKEVTDAAVAATCTKDGKTEGKHCSVCGTVTKAQETVKATGHKEVTDKAVSATCTKNGKTEGKHCSVCGTVTKAQEAVKATGHSFANGKCAACGTEDPNYGAPVVNTVTRVAGADRYLTAFAAADELKEALGVSKFQNMIVTCGTNFPDALSGTYLAAQKNAPILLVKGNNVSQVNEYIQKNLAPGGTLYLLGDNGVVPDSVGRDIHGIYVKRLGGATRYDTNLLILQEAGVGNKDIIVCTGLNFADSLSASAAGLPILLVKGGLTDSQKAFLASSSGRKIIVGGTAAVSASVESQLKAYGEVKRLAGDTRYDTSVLVAKEFFQNPSYVVLAYAQNFPDGLSGGPLAYALKAPLILTDSKKPTAAVNYATGLGIKSGYVLGGTGLISDSVVKNVFSMDAGEAIRTK